MSTESPTLPSARERLLGAATDIVRAQGYAGTSVDALCTAAGVTKGAFFHHFPSKEALAVAAAARWRDQADAMFGAAPCMALPDPLDRVMGYIDLRTALLDGPPEAFTCLAGTMVQEAFATNPAIRSACESSIFGHASFLEADLDAAIRAYRVEGVTAASLAAHIQAVLQGAFVLAKARGDAAVARDSARHLRRYFEFLFKINAGEDDERVRAARGHAGGDAASGV